MSRRNRRHWGDRPPAPEGGRAHAAQQAVERIYHSAHGGRPDFTRFDRRPPRWQRWAVAGMLIALAAAALAAWAGFVVFGPGRRGNETLTVTIDAPPATGIGDAVIYRVTVVNDARVPVAAATLEVRTPEDFLLAAAEPAPDDTRTLRWTLGAIGAGGRAEVALHGHLYGAPTAQTRITATTLYRPGNFNADFEARAEATTVLGASMVTLALEGPPRAVPGEEVTYTVRAMQTGDTPSPPLRVTLDVPRAFVLRETNPKRENDLALSWMVGELAPGAERTITVRGRFTAGAATPFDLRATATITPSGSRTLLLADTTMYTEVLGSAVALVATANDQTAAFPVHAGDALRIRIVARNNGTAPIRQLTARAVFDATSVAEKSILNFNASTDPANGAAVGEQLAPGLRRGTVTWTSAEIPALAELAPGATHTIDIAIPLHTSTTLPGMSARATLTFHAALTVGAVGDTATPFTITTTPIAISVQ